MRVALFVLTLLPKKKLMIRVVTGLSTLSYDVALMNTKLKWVSCIKSRHTYNVIPPHIPTLTFANQHVFWDARPIKVNTKYFRPWIQIHNIMDMKDHFNDAMSHWSNERLSTHVKNFMKKNPGKPCPVLDQRNFHGRFVSELNLYEFPFDMQRLRITIVTSPTSEMTFTHKVKRDAATGLAFPMMINNHPMSSIIN